MSKELKFYKNIIFVYYETLKCEINLQASLLSNERINFLRDEYFKRIQMVKSFNIKNFETKYYPTLHLYLNTDINVILFEQKFVFFVKSNLYNFGQLIQTDKYIKPESRKIIEEHIIEWSKIKMVKMKIENLDQENLESYLLVKYSIDIWNQLSILELNSDLIKNITELHLMCHKFRTVKNCFRNVINCLILKELHLQSNGIKNLAPNCFEDLKNLKKLNLSKNEIKYLDDALNGLTSLQYLDLSMNSIEKIDRHCFSELKNLVCLNLNFNKLQVLYFNRFETMDYLFELNVSNNNLTSVYFDLKLESLQILNLSWNLLTSLNEEISSCLPNLKHVDISFNKFKLFQEFPNYKFKILINN